MQEKTLIDILRNRSIQRENDNFVVEIKSEQTLSYKKLKEQVELAAETLEQIGIQKNEKVAILVENSISFMKLFFSVLWIEAVVVPINPELKEEEINYIMRDADIKTILIQDKIIDKMIFLIDKNDIIKKMDTISIIKKVDILEHKNEDLILNTALILYTSGSTGRAKGVMLTHRNLISEMKNISLAHELCRDDIVLAILPWFHINGLVITMLTPLLVGHKIIIAQKFSKKLFWSWIEKYSVTWFSGVPTIYAYLLSESYKKEYDTSSLRFARSASFALPRKILEEFEKKYKIFIIESYGITEGGSQITTNPMPPKKRKIGSVGIPYGLDLKIINDKNLEVGVFEEGEIIVRGDNITRGYYKKEKETKEAFFNSWFRTGDLGYIDKEGYLFLSGRKKELINRAGEKFSPKEIDEVLYSMSEIELACAVGVPNELYGEEVIAFIKKKKEMDITAEDIIEYCKGRIANFKVPKEIYFIEDFPQGGNGKIQRLKFVDYYNEIKKNISKGD